MSDRFAGSLENANWEDWPVLILKGYKARLFHISFCRDKLCIFMRLHKQNDKRQLSSGSGTVVFGVRVGAAGRLPGTGCSECTRVPVSSTTTLPPLSSILPAYLLLLLSFSLLTRCCSTESVRSVGVPGNSRPGLLSVPSRQTLAGFTSHTVQCISPLSSSGVKLSGLGLPRAEGILGAAPGPHCNSH